MIEEVSVCWKELFLCLPSIGAAGKWAMPPSFATSSLAARPHNVESLPVSPAFSQEARSNPTTDRTVALSRIVFFVVHLELSEVESMLVLEKYAYEFGSFFYNIFFSFMGYIRTTGYFEYLSHYYALDNIANHCLYRLAGST